MEAQTIIFIGSQGSGKGTQVDLLKDYLSEKDQGRDIFHHDTGRCFRSFVKDSDTYTAREVKESINLGELQLDFLPIWIVVDDCIKHMTPDAHLIVDGSPRSVLQADVFSTILDFYNRDTAQVIFLDVSEETSIKRLLSRGREDDTREGIEERLKAYRDRTVPLLSYFKDHLRYKPVTVNGEKSAHEVHEDIKRALGIE